MPAQSGLPIITFEQTYSAGNGGGLYADNSHDWLAVYATPTLHGHQLLIEGDDYGYYISHYSFKAVPFNAESAVTYHGEVIPTEGMIIEGNASQADETIPFDFTVESGSNRVWLEDFTVTLSLKNPDGLPANWNNQVHIKQITSVEDFIAGKQYVFRVVSNNEAYGGDGFLVATTEMENNTSINVAEFKRASEIADANSGITTTDMLWTATATSGISTTHAKGQQLSDVVTLSNGGLYFQTRHGNANHNTDTSNGALYVSGTTNGVNHTGNLVYATKLKEHPSNAYFNFAVYPRTHTSLADRGQTFNIAINSNSQDTVTNLTTYLDIFYHSGHSQGFMEIGAGSNGTNYTATNSQFFVVYEVIPDDAKAAITPEYNSFREQFDEYVSAEKPGLNPGDLCESSEYLAIGQAVIDAYDAEPFDYENFMAALDVWRAFPLSLYHISSVERGTIITITGQYNRKYSFNGSTFDFSSAEGKSTFYYTHEGHLVNIGSGLAVKRRAANNSYLDAASTANEHEDFNSADIPVVTFNYTETALYSDKFLFNFDRYNNDGTAVAEGYVYNNPTQTNYNVGNGSAADRATFLHNVNNNIAPWSYTIEYVKELPVAIHADAKGTIIAPIELKRVDDREISTWTASTDAEGNYIFTEVTDDTPIPANTPIVIKTPAAFAGSTVFIRVADKDTLTSLPMAYDNESSNKSFVCSYLLKNVPTTDANNPLYVKDETSQVVSDEHIAFVKAPEGGVINPGQLAFYAIHDKEGDAPEKMTLSLTNGNNGTTFIEEVVDGKLISDVICDLQGRRLNKPMRGINIINGRKVLVK